MPQEPDVVQLLLWGDWRLLTNSLPATAEKQVAGSGVRTSGNLGLATRGL